MISSSYFILFFLQFIVFKKRSASVVNGEISIKLGNSTYYLNDKALQVNWTRSLEICQQNGQTPVAFTTKAMFEDFSHNIVKYYSENGTSFWTGGKYDLFTRELDWYNEMKLPVYASEVNFVPKFPNSSKHSCLAIKVQKNVQLFWGDCNDGHFRVICRESAFFDEKVAISQLLPQQYPDGNVIPPHLHEYSYEDIQSPDTIKFFKIPGTKFVIPRMNQFLASWGDAIDICNKKGYQLAYISNLTEFQELDTFFKKYNFVARRSFEEFWICSWLDDNGEWININGDYLYMQYPFFSIDDDPRVEFNETGATAVSVGLNSYNHFNMRRRCSEDKKNFLCQKIKPWDRKTYKLELNRNELIQMGDSHFYYGTMEKTWDQARLFCRDFNKSLLYLRDKNEESLFLDVYSKVKDSLPFANQSFWTSGKFADETYNLKEFKWQAINATVNLNVLNENWSLDGTKKGPFKRGRYGRETCLQIAIIYAYDRIRCFIERPLDCHLSPWQFWAAGDCEMSRYFICQLTD